MTDRRPPIPILALYSHLTDRDKLLLAPLDEHKILTTDQIARLHVQALPGHSPPSQRGLGPR
jgi:hypothetical protein